MEKLLLVEVANRSTETLITDEENENFLEIMELISEMNVVGFEQKLDEDLNSKLSDLTPGKYQILAILRDLFIEYKSGGDTQLLVETGTCGHSCDRKCPVINLQGNNSGKNFAFGIDKEDSNVINFHTCYGFVNKNKSPKYIDGEMMMNSFRKAAEMKGKDTSIYDETMKKVLLSAVKVFHEK